MSLLSKTPSFSIHDENAYTTKPSVMKKNIGFGGIKKVQINAKTPEKTSTSFTTKSNRKALSNLSTSQINSRLINPTNNNKNSFLIEKPVKFCCPSRFINDIYLLCLKKLKNLFAFIVKKN